ncbi:MAG: hypothetical protein WCH99_06030 [Verrucomicrobiota bacterium]
MKSFILPRFSYLALSLTGLMAATQPSKAQITWVPLADNQGTPALTPNCPSPTNLQPYLKFDPPVMPPKTPVLAYKAWLRPGAAITGPVVTVANDEGVWGTGPELSSSGTISYLPTLILREGDATSTAIGAPTYGSGGTLAINNLQMSMRGDTIFQANLSSVGGKAALHDNCCLQIMAQSSGTTPLYADIRPPVIDWSGENVSEWLFYTAADNGISHFGYAAGTLPPCASFTENWLSHSPTMAASPGWGVFRPTPAPIGSPAIGFNGVTLYYAVDSIATPSKRPHLRVSLPMGTPQFVLNRSRDLVPATDLYYPSGRLGIYSPKLLCVADPSIAGLWGAWQMSMMLYPTAVVEPSLWVQRSISAAPECFVKRGIAAPGTGSTFFSFYEMQIVDDTAGSGARWVFFGANPTSGARAIYVMTIQTASSSPLGPLTLIATEDVGFGTPLGIAPPFIGSSTTITTLQPWFSIDLRGNIAFLASSTGLPAGSQQVLCTASGMTPNPVVRSQQGLPIATLTSGSAVIRRFDLAKPDQGVISRGQAINGAGYFAARILFRYAGSSGVVTNGEGIYLGN